MRYVLTPMCVLFSVHSGTKHHMEETCFLPVRLDTQICRGGGSWTQAQWRLSKYYGMKHEENSTLGTKCTQGAVCQKVLMRKIHTLLHRGNASPASPRDGELRENVNLSHKCHMNLNNLEHECWCAANHWMSNAVKRCHKRNLYRKSKAYMQDNNNILVLNSTFKESEGRFI